MALKKAAVIDAMTRGIALKPLTRSRRDPEGRREAFRPPLDNL
jgi:hypothetical protein